MSIPPWVSQILPIVALAVSAIVGYTRLSEHVSQLENTVNVQASEIAALETEKIALSQLLVKVDWASWRADEAKKVADLLLQKHLSEGCNGKR